MGSDAFLRPTTNIAGATLIKTIGSADKRNRVNFCRRADGKFQYEVQVLIDSEEQGQKYSSWCTYYPPSGIFSDLALAEADASLSLAWIRNEPKGPG